MADQLKFRKIMAIKSRLCLFYNKTYGVKLGSLQLSGN